MNQFYDKQELTAAILAIKHLQEGKNTDFYRQNVGNIKKIFLSVSNVLPCLQNFKLQTILKLMFLTGSMAGEALKYMVEKILATRNKERTKGGLLTKAVVITDGKSQDFARGTMNKYQRIAKVGFN